MTTPQGLSKVTLRDRITMYAVAARQAILEQLQYRLANMLFMIHLLIEPVIYLVVWTTVANAQGGQVGGYTAAEFAGYYIIWTLVRQFNLALGPNNFQYRIKEGRLAAELLRPVHPIQVDLGYYLGYKVPATMYWLPVGVLLWLVFRPEIHPLFWQAAAFPLALILAFLIRFALLWLLGLVCFWTERIDALFELYFTLELLFSGACLVPLEIMPTWAQNLASYMPFQWAFYFPIEVLLGRTDVNQFITGTLTQLLWVGVCFGAVLIVWKQAVRHFTAVGG